MPSLLCALSTGDIIVLNEVYSNYSIAGGLSQQKNRQLSVSSESKTVKPLSYRLDYLDSENNVSQTYTGSIDGDVIALEGKVSSLNVESQVAYTSRFAWTKHLNFVPYFEIGLLSFEIHSTYKTEQGSMSYQEKNNFDMQPYYGIGMGSILYQRSTWLLFCQVSWTQTKGSIKGNFVKLNNPDSEEGHALFESTIPVINTKQIEVQTSDKEKRQAQGNYGEPTEASVVGDAELSQMMAMLGIAVRTAVVGFPSLFYGGIGYETYRMSAEYTYSVTNDMSNAITGAGYNEVTDTPYVVSEMKRNFDLLEQSPIKYLLGMSIDFSDGWAGLIEMSLGAVSSISGSIDIRF